MTTPNYLEERYGTIEGRGNGISGLMWKELGKRIASTKLLRNASTVAIPPTGRSALTIGASTGIEPLFSLINPDGEMHKDLERDLNNNGFLTEVVKKQIHEGGKLPLHHLPRALHEVYKTALELDPLDHLQIVRVVQSVVDEAISKTINLPANSSSREIEEIYMHAHVFGLKGVTIFRNGSRSIQPRKVAHHEEDPNSQLYS